MTRDARFEDGGEAPLRLKAQEPDDLPILSALVQDAVFPIAEMRYDRRQRRFALLVNRFRWEDLPAAERRKRTPERVRALLVVDDVQSVSTLGIDRSEKDTVLCLLSLTWEPGEDGSGRVIFTLSGDGAIAVAAECLDVTLRDVTRPYAAPSRKAPRHPD